MIIIINITITIISMIIIITIIAIIIVKPVLFPWFFKPHGKTFVMAASMHMRVDLSKIRKRVEHTLRVKMKIR